MERSKFTRRTVLGAGAAAGLLGAIGARAAGLDRPNILWLVSEDNNPFIGAYGDRIAHTPTIDALARRGVRFDKAYSNAPVCAPSRFAILTGVHPESCAPANQMRATAPAAGILQTYPEILRRAGYWCTNNAKTDYNADFDPAKLWDEQGKQAHWRSRPTDRPFMAVFNYETTHESRLFHRVEGRVKPHHVRVPPYLPDTPQVRVDIAGYYNLIERMDGELAARLAELEADRLTGDTIVFYYSDNGGVLPRSKRYAFDEGLRCALVVAAPEKWRHLLPASAGESVQNPVSLVDLAPTVLSAASIAVPSQMRGTPFLRSTRANAGPPPRLAFAMRDRMDERIDMVRTVTDGRWRYIRNYMPHRPWSMHGAFEWQLPSYQSWEREYLAGRLDPTQARFFQSKPFEELYDLAGDPDQTVNLAASQGKRRIALARALDAHMLAIGDQGFIPESFGWNWAEIARGAKPYRLRSVMRLAGRAASGKAAVAELSRAMHGEDPVRRYWGATGLLIAGTGALEAATELCAAAQGAQPATAIVAAEALVALGDQGGIPVLRKFAGAGHSWQVRLFALNALTALGEQARPALPEIEAAAADNQEYLRNAGRYLSAVLKGEYRPDYPVYDPPPGRR